MTLDEKYHNSVGKNNLVQLNNNQRRRMVVNLEQVDQVLGKQKIETPPKKSIQKPKTTQNSRFLGFIGIFVVSVVIVFVLGFIYYYGLTQG